MSECKHEWYLKNGRGYVFCGVCGKSVPVENLFERLQAENAYLKRQVEELAQGLKAYDSGEHPNQVMREEAIHQQLYRRPLEFTDGNSNTYEVYYDGGDYSVGIPGGWVCDEEFSTPEMVEQAVKEATAELQAKADKTHHIAKTALDDVLRLTQERDDIQSKLEMEKLCSSMLRAKLWESEDIRDSLQVQCAAMKHALEEIKDCLEQNIDDPDIVAIELVTNALNKTKTESIDYETI